jgi:hypothetical protein
MVASSSISDVELITESIKYWHNKSVPECQRAMESWPSDSEKLLDKAKEIKSVEAMREWRST